jgi:hypothetical protein
MQPKTPEMPGNGPLTRYDLRVNKLLKQGFRLDF